MNRGRLLRFRANALPLALCRASGKFFFGVHVVDHRMQQAQLLRASVTLTERKARWGA